MDIDNKTIDLLISKIQTGLPEIKLRSISTLHSKISVGLLPAEKLPSFKRMPGVLLQWINDNNTKSDHLFNVLTILSHFIETEDGIVLLMQYEALEFFQELRKYLLAHERNVQDFAQILSRMIKALLPLAKHYKNLEIQINQEKQKKSQISLISQSKVGEYIERSQILETKDLVLKFTVAKDNLGKKEDEQLYSLMMELRHGKKQLQFSCLANILKLIKYWGYKCFRFKSDLIKQLCQTTTRNTYSWIAIQSIFMLLKQLNGQHEKVVNGQNLVLNLGKSKIEISQKQTITIQIKKQLFQHIYSYKLFEEIFNYTKLVKKQEQYKKIIQWLLYLPYKQSPKYFIFILNKVLNLKNININKKLLNNQIIYYFSKFPQIQQIVIEMLLSESNKLINIEEFSQLKKYLGITQSKRSYEFLKKYVQNFQINDQLHQFNLILDNLQKGVKGISFKNQTHLNLKIYFNVLLVVGIATARQDPLISHYPRIKSIISSILIDSSVSTSFYEQLLSICNSFQKFTYLSKNYVSSEIVLLILTDDSFFETLFEKSFQKEATLVTFLQISKRVILTQSNFTGFKKFIALLYCLTYHKNKSIANLSNLILDKIPKKQKYKILLLKLFSRDENERKQMCLSFGGQNYHLLSQQLTKQIKIQKAIKKPLKISFDTIQNYINIIFNTSLQIEVRMSGISEVLQILERIELNQNIEELLTNFNSNIVNALSNEQNLQLTLIPSYFKIYSCLKNSLKDKSIKLKQQVLVYLLQIIKQPDTILLVLQQIYIICFQNPFTLSHQQHYCTLLYPHYQLITIPISKQIIAQNFKNEDIDKEQQNQSSHQQIKKYNQYAQQIISQTLNQNIINLDQTFVDWVEKQISQNLISAKSHDCLHYLAFSLTTLANFKYSWPQKLSEHSSNLLNSLISKEQSLLHSQAVASILTLIGFRKTKQVSAIIFQFSEKGNQWRYKLILSLQILENNQLQIIIKRLLGITCTKESLLILKIIKKFAIIQQLSEYSLTLITTSLTKFFKQTHDLLLQRYSLHLLCTIFQKKQNHSLFGEDLNIVGSLCSMLLEQQTTIEVSCLSLEIISYFILFSSNFQQLKLMKMLLGKLCPPLYENPLPKSILLAASTFNLINSLLTVQFFSCIQQLDLSDCSITIWNVLIQKSKNQTLSLQSIYLLNYISQFLYLWVKVQKDIGKYILTSTNGLYLMLETFKLDLSMYSNTPIIQNISRLWHYLSQKQEDLYIYKLNYILSSDQKQQSIIEILTRHIAIGKQQFLKMLAWFIIVWTKQSYVIDQKNLGDKLSQAYLKSKNPMLIKGLLAISWQAKLSFLSSQFLNQLIKQTTNIIENKLVLQMKQSKKKRVKAQIDETMKSQYEPQTNLQINRIQATINLLTALFHNNEDIVLGSIDKVRQPMKKIVILIEKIYSLSLNEPRLSKSIIKLITNLIQCKGLSSLFASRFTDNSSLIIDDIISNILKNQKLTTSTKLSFCLLSVLSHYQPVRSYILKSRLIQELNNRISKIEDPKNEINLHYIYQIVNFYLVLSLYKQTNGKLIMDKKILENYLTFIKLQKLSLLDQKIILLLSNIVCFKNNKNLIMSNQLIHKVILWLFQKQDFQTKDYLFMFLYNLSYKNSAAIKLYRKSQVINLLKSVSATQKYKETKESLLEALEFYQN